METQVITLPTPIAAMVLNDFYVTTPVKVWPCKRNVSIAYSGMRFHFEWLDEECFIDIHNADELKDFVMTNSNHWDLSQAQVRTSIP